MAHPGAVSPRNHHDPPELSRRAASWLAVFLLLLSLMQASASSLKKDEDVVFFPTAASLDKERGVWLVPVHGWIFEPEEDSIWRSILVEELLGWVEMRSDAVDDMIFRSRARMFLVDNERGKQFTIEIGGKSIDARRSEPNGHFRQSIELEPGRVSSLPPGAWLPFHIDTAQTMGTKHAGRVQIVPPEGLSVISDIDDTIKVSNVLDKRELLENTFLREFKAVPGMSSVYRRWAESGAVFHYVSASPWQLYPALDEFMAREVFPPGSFSLRYFRVKDRTFFNIFSSPEETKIPVIESIVSRYPGRRFILVGDSGEKDPEVYGEIARRHRDQVVRIFIRNVPESDVSRDRYRAAFEALDENIWTVFSDPAELGEIEIIPEGGLRINKVRFLTGPIRS